MISGLLSASLPRKPKTKVDMTLLGRLLARADHIEISNGRLVISPASGKPVPTLWLKKNRAQLLREIAICTDTRLFSYESYSTGRYSISEKSSVKSPGVTLSYYAIRSDEFVSATFNAELDRKRTTKGGKQGSPLPAGQFRVSNRHKFLRYWDNTGIERPLRLSSFHDCMGKLRDVVMTGELQKAKRLNKDTIRPAEITSNQLRQALGLSDNIQTNSLQLPDNHHTTAPDKEIAQSHVGQGFCANESAWSISRVPSNQESEHISDVKPVIQKTLDPTKQTHEEWLAEYETESKSPDNA